MSHEERRERRRRMAERVRDGASPGDIAREFGVGVETVLTACDEHGVAAVDYSRRTAPTTFRILAALWDGSRSMQAIADGFGISKQRVHDIYGRAVAAGIPVPDRSRGAE